MNLDADISNDRCNLIKCEPSTASGALGRSLSQLEETGNLLLRGDLFLSEETQQHHRDIIDDRNSIPFPAPQNSQMSTERDQVLQSGGKFCSPGESITLAGTVAKPTETVEHMLEDLAENRVDDRLDFD
eukprot:198249_1